MWRGSSTYRSMMSVSSPNELSASRFAPATASASALASRTTRMPLPPPPALAFTSTGKPRSSARAQSVASDWSAPA